jgi:hypothetical protein
MPIVGEKTSEYPFGYGCSQCGCGKVTKVFRGVSLSYLQEHAQFAKIQRRLHHPRDTKTTREMSQRRTKQILANPKPPKIKQPTLKAIAREQENERLARTVAWTKVNQNFINWNRRRLRARTMKLKIVIIGNAASKTRFLSFWHTCAVGFGVRSQGKT